MSESDLAISIRGLSKSYTITHGALKRPTFRDVLMERIRRPFHKPQSETFWALKDINFDVKKGEVVGIIGRNGAGKSTLLKILSRITEPTTGRIEVYGRVGSLLEVGTGFHPELTGRENIYLNGAILGMSRGEIRKQFDAIVDFAEVEKFIDTPVKRYSSGMYVRLAFAVAAHLNPEILIVDEVLAVGDAEFQKKCLGKMGEVAAGGRTVLFVSHNMAAVRTLCQTCILLRGGIKQYQGDTNECISHYSQAEHGQHVPIVSLLRSVHPDVVVEEVSVNGVPDHVVPISTAQSTIDISFRGVLKHELRMDLELWLCDRFDMPLAFYGYGHQHGVSPVRSRGTFALRRVLELPARMHKGVYYLRLALTDHNVCYWMDCPRAVLLEVQGVPTATGRPLAYDEAKGFISLAEVA